ncbi:MAG TPA: alpha/beta fold hydrolase [Chthoniobacteraceae bacterium]|jgi:pimeloyl-ACP methyl ester carboxylesterase|nr:alpha/beta fold hydrolase [Chthoniobacteraceae bacterium]
MPRSKLFRVFRTLVLTYVVALILAAVFQRSLIYHPFHETEAALVEEARVLGLEPWRDAAGATIGWKSPARAEGRARNRLVVFNGNAGYALHRAAYVEGFEHLEAGRLWEVYLFEYPGYGARSGSPGERVIVDAGLAALETLAREDERPIFLLGESLGSGPACALAGRRPERVRGLILWTPFASLTEVAAHHYPFLPVRLILRDRWENAAALKNYHGPVGVRVAELDEIVTSAQGHKLYESYAGPKRLWIAPGATHNMFDLDRSASWWSEASAFLLGEAP